MSSSLRQTNEVIGGVQAIIRAYNMLRNSATGRLSNASAESVLLLCEAAALSEWDVTPDMVTDMQLERWVESNGAEAPQYRETRRGLVPLCSWLVVSYDVWGNGGDESEGVEPSWEVNDEHRDGTVEAPEDPTDEEVCEVLRLAGWRMPEEKDRDFSLEWTDECMCEIYRTDGKPMGRIVKGGI